LLRHPSLARLLDGDDVIARELAARSDARLHRLCIWCEEATAAAASASGVRGDARLVPAAVSVPGSS
jgi:hypothetical protein